MKTLINVVLLLVPLPMLNAALISESDHCCALDSRVETTPAATERAEVLNNLGSEFYAAGQYAKAEAQLRAALATEQAATEPKPALVASTLVNLAAAIRMQSRLPEDASLYQQAIAIRATAAGEDSPDLGRALSGLALVYASGGQINEAIDTAERAVRVGSNRPQDVKLMAITHNTLATLLMMRGEAGKAETLEQRVVDELKRAGLTDNHEYVNAITNLGTSRLRQGSVVEAERDLRAAETAALKSAGPEHPLTATVWNNLAKAYAVQGDWKNAEPLFTKALGAWRKTLGPGHPDVANCLTNLASLNQSRKRYAEAERLYWQALEIDDAALGANSLKVANDWNNLGALSAARRNYREAEKLMTKALFLAEHGSGATHPDTAGIAVNLAVVYYSQGKYDDASVLLEKVLPVKERVLGPDSPELASLLRLYASSQKATRNYVAAEKAELKATRITTHNALLAAR